MTRMILRPGLARGLSRLLGLRTPVLVAAGGAMARVQDTGAHGGGPHDAGARDWHDDAAGLLGGPSLRRVAVLSLLTIVLGFGGLTAWAGLARIDSAVGAPGVFVAAGRRKTLSVLDPGLLRAMRVREGDRVAAGQLLLELDDVQARAAREQAHLQLWGAAARVARLAAEAADSRVLVFDPAVEQACADPAVASQVAAERALFEARWRSYDDLLRVGQRHLSQLEAQGPILEAQLQSVSTRLDLTRVEQRSVDALLALGYQTRPRMVELHLGVADLAGQAGEIRGQLAQGREAVQQASQELVSEVSVRHADISKDMREAEALRVDAAERERGAADTLLRRELRAPEAGIVTDIKLFTPGSSIGAGQPILDLVPLDDSLLIQASVGVGDIERVQVGQRVNVRLTAYKAHRVPVVAGHLVYVGADRQLDAQGQPVFLARVALDPDALRGLNGVVAYAGMPADVLIIAGERSVLDYLTAPIRENLRHGLHEE